jgi:hypothetical protein
MKIYKLSGKVLNVANVGGFGSINDRIRLDMASDWLSYNDPDYSENIKFSHDNIDLNSGRDFLKESKSYNIVILHDIFNPVGENDLSRGIFSVSPDHNADSWVKRLASTGADYIFVFGSWTEVGGWWLGDIPGYDKTYGTSEYQTIYRNKKLPPIEIKPKKKIDWDKVNFSFLKA